MTAQPLLSIDHLRVELTTRDGVFPVLDNVSFTLEAGRRLAIIGESGCGKSMTALAIMGLLPTPGARVTHGEVRFNGEDLTQASKSRMRDLRGNDISMIFQEPMTSLNPVWPVGDQIGEIMRQHLALNKQQSRTRAIELLDAVRIPEPQKRYNSYPHELSGGQRQRVMIAMALACEPKLLIADEPTTALDVTVQAEIFDLLLELHKRTSAALLLITHDMGAVCQMSQDMIVMYAGRKIESGPVRNVISSPAHFYTRGLIGSVPHIHDDFEETRSQLSEIPGLVPPLSEFGKAACMFAPRCPHAGEPCWTTLPPPVVIKTDTAHSHVSHCHFAPDCTETTQ